MGPLLKACQTYKSRDMRLDNAVVFTDSSILKTNVLFDFVCLFYREIKKIFSKRLNTNLLRDRIRKYPDS